VAGTGDDGTIVENFDVDKNGDGVYTVFDTFLDPTAPGVYRGHCSTAPQTTCQTGADCPLDAGSNPGVCYSGSYIHGSYDATIPGLVAGVSCGGFDTPATNPTCILDPRFPMDWHFHCAPGSTHCPNNELIPGTTTPRTCIGGCSYNTPANGAHSVSGTQSLHMGAHFDPNDYTKGDTTHLRTLQGFQSAPINVALVPGDIPATGSRATMSFYQIADLMRDSGEGNGGIGGGHQAGQCVDCGDVQIQLDRNPDPGVDDWGPWGKLVPFENVYDQKVLAWSAFTSYYCVFTPTDTGTAPPNPRGVHETLCFPQGAWANCGSIDGTTTANVHRCAGPGVLDASGKGTWVRTKFDLSTYIGQRIRVRWIAETWDFGREPVIISYQGLAWGDELADDGWWIDDVTVNGAITTQMTPLPDTSTRANSCPAQACNPAVGDAGTAATLDITDLAGRPVDAVTFVPVAGQTLRLSASGSTLPGGCNGVAEYEIRKNGAVILDWSPKPFVLDAPDATAHYAVRVRCSADHDCTSVLGAARDVGVDSGDGGEVALGAWGSPFSPATAVTYDRVTATTTLSWWTPGVFPADVYRGLIGPGITKGSYAAPFWRLDTSGATGSQASCLRGNVAGTPETAPPAGPGGTRGTIGPLNQVDDPNPPINSAEYYVVAADGANGDINALGCANPAICTMAGWCELGTNAGAPCNISTDCAGGGSCLVRQTFCKTSAGAGGLGGCGRYPVCAGGTNAGRLCHTDTDCPVSTCAQPAAGATTAGSVCLNVSGQMVPSPAGTPTTPCPPAGSPARVVTQVPVPGICL
jgi:hypothetical protein